MTFHLTAPAELNQSFEFDPTHLRHEQSFQNDLWNWVQGHSKVHRFQGRCAELTKHSDQLEAKSRTSHRIDAKIHGKRFNPRKNQTAISVTFPSGFFNSFLSLFSLNHFIPGIRISCDDVLALKRIKEELKGERGVEKKFSYQNCWAGLQNMPRWKILSPVRLILSSRWRTACHSLSRWVLSLAVGMFSCSRDKVIYNSAFGPSDCSWDFPRTQWRCAAQSLPSPIYNGQKRLP